MTTTPEPPKAQESPKTPEEYDLRTQNEKLQELKNQVEVTYTQQSYALDQIQTLISRNWWLFVIYYLLVIVNVIFIGYYTLLNYSTLTTLTIVGRIGFIIFISAYPYLIGPILSWLYTRWILIRQMVNW